VFTSAWKEETRGKATCDTLQNPSEAQETELKENGKTSKKGLKELMG
jgi:hypothetical protein